MTGAAAPTAAGDRALARPSARLVGAFAVVTVALLLGGYLFYRSQERYQRNDAREALVAVSVLKVDQISRWREDILGSAGVLSLDSRLAGWIQQYRAAPTPAVQTILRLRLEPWIGGKTLADIAVTDPAGNILFSLSGE